jgi:hypothetical protein
MVLVAFCVINGTIILFDIGVSMNVISMTLSNQRIIAIFMYIVNKDIIEVIMVVVAADGRDRNLGWGCMSCKRCTTNT